jgi:hypothetical protein
MPKIIDATLVAISFDSGTGGAADLEISGRIFGTTFNENPHEEKSQRDIFTFPDGPITVAQGTPTAINSTATFVLSTPSTEPERLNGKFLQFGGSLDNFGSGSKTITTFDIIQVNQPQSHSVRIVSGNAEIRLDFTLNETGFF